MAKTAKKFNLVCNGNGCSFLKEALGSRAADREATSHMAATGHDVSRVPVSAMSIAHGGDTLEHVARTARPGSTDQVVAAMLAEEAQRDGTCEYYTGCARSAAVVMDSKTRPATARICTDHVQAMLDCAWEIR